MAGGVTEGVAGGQFTGSELNLLVRYIYTRTHADLLVFADMLR